MDSVIHVGSTTPPQIEKFNLGSNFYIQSLNFKFFRSPIIDSKEPFRQAV
jgi:hypothetical protein